MNHKKELRIAYGLMIVLLLIGIISYTTFSSKEDTETPLRMMYKTTAGNVLFDHKTHVSETGYGIACEDCHHHPEDDESALVACNSCHINTDKNTEPAKSCLDCHDAGDIEDLQMKNRIDAFHEQCISCHEASKHGPVDCSECHTM